MELLNDLRVDDTHDLGVPAQSTGAVGLSASIFLFVPHKKDLHLNPSRGGKFKFGV
jgi:hypothetical protein